MLKELRNGIRDALVAQDSKSAEAWRFSNDRRKHWRRENGVVWLGKNPYDPSLRERALEWLARH